MKVKAETVLKMAAVLKTSVAYLMGETNDPNCYATILSERPESTGNPPGIQLPSGDNKHKTLLGELVNNNINADPSLSRSLELQPMVFEYSEGNKRIKLTIPKGTSKEDMQAAILEVIRAVSGTSELSPEHSKRSLHSASGGDTLKS